MIGVDRVPERLALAAASGVEIGRPRRGGRHRRGRLRPDRRPWRRRDASTQSAWRPTARRWRRPRSRAVGMLPDALAKPLTDKLAIDRLAALNAAIKSVRRGGTVSVSRGVRRRDGPDADDGDVRPRHHHALRPVPRAAVDRRDRQGARARTSDVLGVERLATHRCRSRRRPTRTRCSRRRRTAASRWCSSRDAVTRVDRRHRRLQRHRPRHGARGRGAGDHVVLVARASSRRWRRSPRVRARWRCVGAVGACRRRRRRRRRRLVSPRARAARPHRRGRPLRRRRGYGRLRGRARRGVRRRAAHQRARLGQRGPPRRPGAAPAAAAVTSCCSAR